jgi:hypothetical protein
MTEDRPPSNERLQKAGDGDFLRALAESVLQLPKEAGVEGSDQRRAPRTRRRADGQALDTRLGTLNLKIREGAGSCRWRR